MSIPNKLENVKLKIKLFNLEMSNMSEAIETITHRHKLGKHWSFRYTCYFYKTPDFINHFTRDGSEWDGQVMKIKRTMIKDLRRYMKIKRVFFKDVPNFSFTTHHYRQIVNY